MLFDREFLDALANVRKSIEISLGPTGKGVLVSRKSPAEMYITKNGRDLLEIYRGSHPFLDIIISSIKVSHCVSTVWNVIMLQGYDCIDGGRSEGNISNNRWHDSQLEWEQARIHQTGNGNAIQGEAYTKHISIRKEIWSMLLFWKLQWSSEVNIR